MNTIAISKINHSYWSYIPTWQLSRGAHIVSAHESIGQILLNCQRVESHEDILVKSGKANAICHPESHL